VVADIRSCCHSVTPCLRQLKRGITSTSLTEYAWLGQVCMLDALSEACEYFSPVSGPSLRMKFCL
jgi:hypothetical protein